MDAQIGDKVRLKGDANRGARGVIEKLESVNLFVRLDESGALVQVPRTNVTNYSLAARKAWERMPARRVGRPKGSSKTDRVSVTLRIDRELWEQFKNAESSGMIDDRTATINAWLAERLTELEQQSPRKASN
jgi:uncharacterized protein (DUF4415 family)